MGTAAVRYQVSKPVLAGREREYVLDALETGWISSSGAYIGRFERAVSDYLDLDDGIAVSNGTVALHLAVLGLGLQPGDDVLVPALTYVATANAVRYCGARPVFVDCDPVTWNVTPEIIDAAWTPKTVGAIAVHLYGLPAPVDGIASVCRARGGWLVEDCAEAFGARIAGRGVGGYGDTATFSFYGNKIVSTGEGGMVFARSPEVRERIKRFKGQGMDPARRYWHLSVGYNYRLTNIAAAIGLGQVEMAGYHVSERRRIAERYLRGLRRLGDSGVVQLPVEPHGYYNVYWLFSLLLRGTADDRRAVQERLLDEFGIETRPFFVPMHRLPMYETDQQLPTAERLGDQGINLPTYSGLAADSIDEICEALERVLEPARRA
jgi:perosamine synthetase